MNPPLTLASLLATASLAFAATGPRPGVASDEPLTFRWRGDDHVTADLPAELGAGVPTAIDLWSGWAREHGYELDLVDDGRVLYVSPERSKSKRALALVNEAVALTDRIAPPSSALAPRTGLASEPAAATPSAGSSTGSASASVDPGATSWTWEDLGPALESQTAVLLDLEDLDDYHDAIRHVADRFAYLRDWAAGAGAFGGFVLEQPLCAAWVRDLPDNEEWSPDAELVNRTAQALLLRRFGRQPFWLTMGLAWHVEFAARGALYCFPYRNEFVGVTDHADWDRTLRRRFKGRDTLAMADLTSWKRGKWDGEQALRSFGVGTFLARHHADELPLLLDALREETLQKGRVHHADGTWELIPGYELTAEEQEAIFTRYLGEGWLDELLESFQKGKSYKP